MAKAPYLANGLPGMLPEMDRIAGEAERLLKKLHALERAWNDLEPAESRLGQLVDQDTFDALEERAQDRLWEGAIAELAPVYESLSEVESTLDELITHMRKYERTYERALAKVARRGG